MKKNGKIIECGNCGKEIYRAKYQLKRRSFCSKSCSAKSTKNGFQKGHPPYIYERSASLKTKMRKIAVENSYKPSFKGRKHSLASKEKMRQKMLGKRLGNKHPFWKGDEAEYSSQHQYLVRHFGKAGKCDNKNCKIDFPKRFEWALIHGRKYTKNREDYVQLCVSCHRKYDQHGYSIVVDGVQY